MVLKILLLKFLLFKFECFLQFFLFSPSLKTQILINYSLFVLLQAAVRRASAVLRSQKPAQAKKAKKAE